jgi:hypothetical protein
MEEALIHTVDPITDDYSSPSGAGFGIDVFNGSHKDGYLVSCYARADLVKTLSGISRKYHIVTINSDAGNNPCKCGISTCQDGELCGMPPLYK